MPKRRTHGFDDRFAAEDNPIGLTGAFAPIKGPQSVDYDSNDDPVGLTQAFGAIPDQDEERSWDEAGKWKDFDWDAALGEPVGDYDSDEDDQTVESFDDAEGADEPASATGANEPAAKSGPKHGRHAAAVPEMSPRMKKSKRTRRVLVVLLILLVLVIAAVAYFAFRTVVNSQQEAAQQTQEQTTVPRTDLGDAPGADNAEASARLADVPDLTVLFGMTQDEAVKELGRGALVTANREVKEEGNPIKTTLNVALTEEPADSKTSTPTVYLGLGSDGKVRQVGYSASASALGFGSLSFADAVDNEHVIEKTLAKVGVTVPEGSATLPADKKQYSTYGSDGTTVVRERCSFEGDTDVNGKACTWSAVLSYDYTTQVVTGNLNDTVRVIYVYITAK